MGDKNAESETRSRWSEFETDPRGSAAGAPESFTPGMEGVARRPVKGGLRAFVSDLRDLLGPRSLKRTFKDFLRHDGTGLAAQLSYYLILAMFPLILVVFSLLGTFSSGETAQEMLGYMQRVLPAQVYDLVSTYMSGILSGESEAPGLLSVGLLGTLWAASGAFSALMKALNAAYEIEESRPFWKAKAIAVGMTVVLAAFVPLAVALLVVGTPVLEAVSGYLGLGAALTLVLSALRYLLALALLAAAVSLVYYVAPDARQPARWITPGGLIGVLLWITSSVAFSFYVGNFGSYNETYGSIGAVIVLLVYLFVSAVAILLGAELNATLARMKEEESGREVIDENPALGSTPEDARSEGREGD